MLECKICGTKFNAVIERHYLARDNGKTGLAVAFGSTAEECLYDAFDCPMCGCQVIAKERKRDYISFVDVYKRQRLSWKNPMLSLKTTENANLRSSDKGEYL